MNACLGKFLILSTHLSLLQVLWAASTQRLQNELSHEYKLIIQL